MDRKKTLEAWRRALTEWYAYTNNARHTFKQSIADLDYELNREKYGIKKEKCKCCGSKLRINQINFCNLCVKAIIKMKDDVADMGRGLRDIGKLKS